MTDYEDGWHPLGCQCCDPVCTRLRDPSGHEVQYDPGEPTDSGPPVWHDWPAGAPIVCSLTDPCAICKPRVDRWKATQPDTFSARPLATDEEQAAPERFRSIKEWSGKYEVLGDIELSPEEHAEAQRQIEQAEQRFKPMKGE